MNKYTFVRTDRLYPDRKYNAGFKYFVYRVVSVSEFIYEVIDIAQTSIFKSDIHPSYPPIALGLSDDWCPISADEFFGNV